MQIAIDGYLREKELENATKPSNPDPDDPGDGDGQAMAA